MRHREHPVGLTDCGRWLGWGIANVLVGLEQFQASQLQAGWLRTGCQPWEQLRGKRRARHLRLMVERRGEVRGGCHRSRGAVGGERERKVPWVRGALRPLSCLGLTLWGV